MLDKRVPLFYMASDIFESINFEDVKKTSHDMWEIGIFQPPYENFFIKIKLKFAKNLMQSFYQIDSEDVTNNKAEIMFEYIFEQNMNGGMIDIFYNMSKDGNDFYDPCDFGLDMTEGSSDLNWFSFMGEAAVNLLIVLLATKNITKEIQTCNKPNSRNRRERKMSQYSSITKISIGKITETMRSSGNGGPVRPHLRRGHIRHQHFGKGNAEVKKIFIQPVFVNADQGWIDAQKEYRVVA